MARTRSFVSAAVGVVTLGGATSKGVNIPSLCVFDEDLNVGRLAHGGYREGGTVGPKSLAQMYIDRFNGRQPRALDSAPRLMLGARSAGTTDVLTNVVTITSKRVRPDYASGRASRSGWSIAPTVKATPASGDGPVAAVPHHVDNAVVVIPALTRVAFTALSRLSSDDGETCASAAPEPLGLPGTPNRKAGVGESATVHAQTLPSSPGVAPHVDAASGDAVASLPNVFAGQHTPVTIMMQTLVALSTTSDIAQPSSTDVPLVHIDLDQCTAIALAPLQDTHPARRPPNSQGTVAQATHVTTQVFEHRRDSVEGQTLLKGGDSFNAMHVEIGSAQRSPPYTTHRSVPRRLPITLSDCGDMPMATRGHTTSLWIHLAAVFRSQTWRNIIGHVVANVIEYTTAAPFLDAATEWGIQLTLTTNLVSSWHVVLWSRVLAYLNTSTISSGSRGGMVRHRRGNHSCLDYRSISCTRRFIWCGTSRSHGPSRSIHIFVRPADTSCACVGSERPMALSSLPSRLYHFARGVICRMRRRSRVAFAVCRKQRGLSPICEQWVCCA